MRVWSITDTGLVRKENQDAYFVEEMADCLVAAVCDGMGGPGGGREASAIAVQTYANGAAEGAAPRHDAQQLGQAFGYCAGMANDAIRARAAQEPALPHMGTTLVAAAARPELAVVTNIGDSRAYLISREGIRQISKDHSLVEDMVDHGELTPQQARKPPQPKSHHPGPRPGGRRAGRHLPGAVEAGGLSPSLLGRAGEHGHGSGNPLRGDPRRGARRSCLQRLLAIAQAARRAGQCHRHSTV